jgi:actinin alpha 1/4
VRIDLPMFLISADVVATCPPKQQGYEGVDIQNFDFSWKDGRGFLALINKYRPDVLDYNATVTSDPRANITLAFTIAR